jgi:thiamine biosynthesis lipoprotein
LTGWDRVERDAETIRLPQAGMELDFGGFGKEYAVDRPRPCWRSTAS